jgi:ATP-binding cassette, subfamily B, bacterial
MSSDVSSDRDLPPAWSSMWQLCRLGYTHEPRLVVAVVALTVLAAVPDALFALWLAVLGGALLSGDSGLVWAMVVAMAISGTLTWLLSVLTTRLTRRFRDKVTIALEMHVARLQASVVGLEHQERSDYLDRLAVLRTQVFVLDHMYMSVLSTTGWLVRVAITVGLLATISPVLILLVLFAVPPVISSAWRPAVEREVEERFARHSRRSEHFFTLGTSAPPGKEIRVTGLAGGLPQRRREEWQRWFRPVSRARWVTAGAHTAAWAIFGVGYVLAVIYVAVVLEAGPAAVLLILAAGARLSAYVGATIGEIGFLRGIWMDGSRRLVWLQNYVAAQHCDDDVDVPELLREGIRLESVSFSYPGTDRLALADVTATIPPGTVVAVVGENGAGKSTLVKLLAKMYEPRSGVILVDRAPLSAMSAAAWRERLSGAFQDFFRFEFAAQRSVGLGDLEHLDDGAAVGKAVSRAGAQDVIERLPDGLASQLGPTWPNGHELSFGQWQKLALARGYMREEPLLRILDEPTAALDAETEHELFERYTAAARSSAVGGITVLVSHRFSTVRSADLILVLDGARLVETGSHDELIRRRGRYAELYAIQAAAYS